MGGGKGGQTIGYHYLGSVLFGIGRGPVNCLTNIKVGDKMAWEGASSSNAVQKINNPDLFGGEKKEGGIQGLFRNFMGKYDQVLPGASPVTSVGTFGAVSSLLGVTGPYRSGVLPDVKAALGGDVSEFRGRHMVWYDGLLASMNPYIKEWSFRRWRTTAGWHNDDPWYPVKATIFLKNGDVRAMNPAHIVYQCITDPAWGRGRDPTELDENSFILAANTFCTESFGLCLQWMREDEVGNFIKTVIDHAAAVVYTDRETGLINLKLIRNDYDPDEIPHFTIDSGLLEITEDDTGSSDAIVDEVIVLGKDPITDQTIEGRSHNLAVRRFRRGATTSKVEYPGLPTIELCNRVAERDRDAAAAGLRKFTVRLDRSGFRIHPGAVFKITYPPRGLNGIVLRAGEIDDGNMINGSITIKCALDVFSMPLTSFVTPVENTYNPNLDPEPADAMVFEASYRDMYLRSSTADLEVLKEGDAMVGVVAGKPNNSQINYDVLLRAEGEPNYGVYGASFTSFARLDASITATQTELYLAGMTDWDLDIVVESMALVNDEYMWVEAWDPETSIVTVKRGCVDTWPRPHDMNSRFWIVDDDIGTDRRTYTAGDTVQALVLPKTATARLDDSLAPLLTTDLVGRPFRPYPPGDVKVGGVSIYDPPGEPEEPGITWVERNRVTQADNPVGFFDPTMTAEPGTTYRIEIYGDDPTTPPLAEYTDIESGWVYDNDMQLADGTIGLGAIYARLYAVRDGVDSLDQPALLFALRKDPGYGMDYGNNYGGDPDYEAP